MKCMAVGIHQTGQNHAMNTDVVGLRRNAILYGCDDTL
jgi:hypothetical protein